MMAVHASSSADNSRLAAFTSPWRALSSAAARNKPWPIASKNIKERMVVVTVLRLAGTKKSSCTDSAGARGFS